MYLSYNSQIWEKAQEVNESFSFIFSTRVTVLNCLAAVIFNKLTGQCYYITASVISRTT